MFHKCRQADHEALALSTLTAEVHQINWENPFSFYVESCCSCLTVLRDYGTEGTYTDMNRKGGGI